MPIYLFSILSTLKSILHEIRGIQHNFLWGGQEDKAKFALVSWDNICQPINIRKSWQKSKERKSSGDGSPTPLNHGPDFGALNMVKTSPHLS